MAGAAQGRAGPGRAGAGPGGGWKRRERDLVLAGGTAGTGRALPPDGRRRAAERRDCYAISENYEESIRMKYLDLF